MLSINLMKMMKNRKIKLLFLTDKLEGGGLERAVVNLINYINRNKFDISLGVMEKKGFFLNKVIAGVKITPIIKNASLIDKGFITRAHRYLHAAYGVYKIVNSKKPDIVISTLNFVGPLAVFVKLFERKTIVLLWLHDYPIKTSKQGILTEIIMNLTFKFADKIICCSKGVRIALNDNFNISLDKTITIYNIIEIDKINRLKNEEIYDDWFKRCDLKIISVGHFESGKGFDYLIKAFKLVIEKGINANLIILGEGTERNIFENLTKNLGLENYVIMPGFKENPYKYMKNSDVFVLSSISEAFPYVLLEAMICGVPIITTEYPSFKDIITNNINGISVPIKDEKTLANAVAELLKNKEMAKRLTENAIKKVKDIKLEKIVNEYEKVFVECYHNK